MVGASAAAISSRVLRRERAGGVRRCASDLTNPPRKSSRRRTESKKRSSSPSANDSLAVTSAIGDDEDGGNRVSDAVGVYGRRPNVASGVAAPSVGEVPDRALRTPRTLAPAPLVTTAKATFESLTSMGEFSLPDGGVRQLL